MTQKDVITAVKLAGFDSIAKRLEYLQNLTIDDPDEQLIKLESLQRFALFVMGVGNVLPEPEIAVSPDGFAQAEWHIPDYGILVMEFLSSDLIDFAVIESSETSSQSLNIRGTKSLEDTMDAIKLFTSKWM